MSFYDDNLSTGFISNNTISSLSEFFTELFLYYAPADDLESYNVDNFLKLSGFEELISTDNFYDILSGHAFLDTSLSKLIRMMSPIPTSIKQMNRYNKHNFIDGYTIGADYDLIDKINLLKKEKDEERKRYFRDYMKNYRKKMSPEEKEKYKNKRAEWHKNKMETDPEYRQKYNTRYLVCNLSAESLAKRRASARKWMQDYKRKMSVEELRAYNEARNLRRRERWATDPEYREKENASRRKENLSPEKLEKRNKRVRENWHNMTPEQRERYYTNRKSRNAKMSREKKDERNAKQREYRKNMNPEKRKAQIQHSVNRKRFRENTGVKILSLLEQIIQSKTR